MTERGGRRRRGGLYLHGKVLVGGVSRGLDLLPHGVGYGEDDAGGDGHWAAVAACGGSPNWWVARASRLMFCRTEAETGEGDPVKA